MTTQLGLGLVILAAVLLAALSVIKRKSPPVFREIKALTRLAKAAGRTVEDGTRFHVSLGRGNLLTSSGAASLAALALLRPVAGKTSVSDLPPVATSGDPLLAILSQDTLKAAYLSEGVGELYDSSSGRLAGMTPFSYAAGVMSVNRDEQVSTNVLIGDFGPEVGLLTDSAERDNTTVIAAAGDLVAQSILFASTEAPLVGEELFAMSAAVREDSSHSASLQVQDILRWLVILLLLAAAGLRLFGVI